MDDKELNKLQEVETVNDQGVMKLEYLSKDFGKYEIRTKGHHREKHNRKHPKTAKQRKRSRK